MRPLPPLPSSESSSNKKEATARTSASSQDIILYEEEDTEDWAAFMEEYDALGAEEEEVAAGLASLGSEGPLVVEEYRVEEDAEGAMRMVQSNKDRQQNYGKDSVKALLRETRKNGAMTEDDWFEFLRRAGIERAGGGNEHHGAFSQDSEDSGKNRKDPPPLRLGRQTRKGPPKFVDRISVVVSGGKGGKGCISFETIGAASKRPSGGHGGRGGNVIFVADPRVQSLEMDRHHFHGKPGGTGDSKNQRGARGRHTVVRVPCGTIVKEVLRRCANGCNGNYYERVQVCDLDEPLSYYTAATGGKPGLGNSIQAGRVRKTSAASGNFRAPGHQGEERYYELELKTIADVGLVGYPNAGKSTLLGGLSMAQPKVAAYPFTTLHPTVGRVEYTDAASLTVADLPGLIEGAHANKGLGHEFLRHIERTKVLLYVLDGIGGEGRGVAAGVEDGSVVEEAPAHVLRKLKEELELYCPGLSRRPSLVWLNKADLNSDWVQEAKSAVEAVLREDEVEVDARKDAGDVEGVMTRDWKVPPILWGSACTGERIGELAHELRRAVELVALEEENVRGINGPGSNCSGSGSGSDGGSRATKGSGDNGNHYRQQLRHEQQQQQLHLPQMGEIMVAVGTTEETASLQRVEEDAAYAEGMFIAHAYSKALEESQACNTEWISGIQVVSAAVIRARRYAAGLAVTYRQNYWLTDAIHSAMQVQQPKGGTGKPTK